MVTYLSGERIQGSSTSSPVTTGYVSIDNESASSSSGSLATSIDLLGETIDNASWVLRFKYTVTSGANGIGSAVAFGLTDNDYQTHALGTQKCIGFKIANSEGGATAGTVSMFPAPDELDPETHINFSSLPFTRYFELRRISASGSAQYTLKAYTASDYTGTPSTADRDPASITGLRYFKIANYTNASNVGGAVGRVTDLKFWNNEQDTTEDPDVDILQSSGTFTSGTWGSMVSPPTSPANGLVSSTTYTDEKTTISNVPVGTRYEETDTRKIFRIIDGYNGSNFNEKFPTTGHGWTLNATYASISSNTLRMQQSSSDGGSQTARASKALTTAITIANSEKMVIDFDLKRNDSANGAKWNTWSLSSADDGYANPASGHRKIAFSMGDNTSIYFQYNTGSGNVESSDQMGSVQPADNTWRYYRVVVDKSTGGFTYKRFLTNAHRTAGTPVEAECSATDINTSWWGGANLAYWGYSFTSAQTHGAYGFTLDNYYDNLKITQNSLTVPAKSWVQKGTA